MRESFKNSPSFKALPMGVRRELSRPLRLPEEAEKTIRKIEAMERDLLTKVLEIQREYGLPHRVSHAKKLGRPVSDQPYPRIQARSRDHYLAHWEHVRVHVEGCYDCYKREYMFFRRHPHLTKRYLRLGLDERAMIGREEPKIDQIPFGLDDAHRRALDRDVVRVPGMDEDDDLE